MIVYNFYYKVYLPFSRNNTFVAIKGVIMRRRQYLYSKIAPKHAFLTKFKPFVCYLILLSLLSFSQYFQKKEPVHIQHTLFVPTISNMTVCTAISTSY